MRCTEKKVHLNEGVIDKMAGLSATFSSRIDGSSMSDVPRNVLTRNAKYAKRMQSELLSISAVQTMSQGLIFDLYYSFKPKWSDLWSPFAGYSLLQEISFPNPRRYQFTTSLIEESAVFKNRKWRWCVRDGKIVRLDSSLKRSNIVRLTYFISIRVKLSYFCFSKTVASSRVFPSVFWQSRRRTTFFPAGNKNSGF